MAILIRTGLDKDDIFGEGLIRNYEAIIKEDLLKRSKATNMSPEEKLESAKKIKNYESKKQLMDRKKKSISKIKKRLKINDTISAFLSISGVIVTLIEAEYDYSYELGIATNPPTEFCNYLRISVLVSTLFLFVTIIIHHSASYKINRERQTTSEGVGTSFIKSANFRWMVLEILVNCLISPPRINLRFTFPQLDGVLTLSLDGIMSACILLRTYIVIRLAKHYTKWGQQDSENICEISGCECSHLFMMKCLFKDAPYSLLCVCITLSVVVFAFAVRVFERPYNDANGQLQDYSYVWNSMWLVIVTMTTVGYGDFYPRTHLGRSVTLIACFWGVFLISMMIVTLTESSEFSKGETKAFELLSRIKKKEEAKKTAAKAIYLALRVNIYTKNSKKDSSCERKKKIFKDQLKRTLNEFKLEQLEWKQWDLPIEEMIRQLTEKLDFDIEELRSKIYSVVEIDSQLQKVENFQNQSLDATAISLTYLDELGGKLDQLIAKHNSL
jgi:Ion channel